MKLLEITSPDLKQLTDEFKSEFDGPAGEKEWGDTLSVCGSEAGNCSMVSHTLVKWLREKGVKATMIVGEDPSNKEWAKVDTSHTVVKVGQTVIDFTAKQFDKKFPIPRIYDLDTFDDEWNATD